MIELVTKDPRELAGSGGMTDWIGVDVASVPEPMNVIYGLSCLCHPEKGIRYVGMTTRGLKARAGEHLHGGNHNLPVAKWIKSHGQENIRAEVLQVEDDFALLNAAEVKWIAKLHTMKQFGGMNLTVGGEGVTGHHHSEATKRRISYLTTGKRHPRWGMKNSPEHRAKISAANKGTHCGESSPSSKLKIGQVLEIVRRRAEGETLESLAVEFGVSIQSVHAIVVGKSWSRFTGIKYDPEEMRRVRQITRLKKEIERQYRRANPLPRPPRSPLSAEVRARIAWSNRGKPSSSILDAAKVVEIRGLIAGGVVQRRIAERFGVTPATINDINMGKTWAWVA